MIPQLMIVHFPVWLVLLLPVVKVDARLYAPIARPGCADTCGNVKIPFPFGIGRNCSRDSWFEIECKATPNSNGSIFNKPFLSKFKVEVLEVILKRKYPPPCEYEQEVIVGVPPLNVCRAETQLLQLSSTIDLRGSPFNFSTKYNNFLIKGCPGSATLVSQNKTIMAGCGTVCHSNNSAISAQNCYGVGCCQTRLPLEVGGYDVYYYYGPLSPLQYYQINFNPQSSGEPENCLVATLIKSDSVNQYVRMLSTSADQSSAAPVALYWSWISNLPPDQNRLANCSNESDITYCSCKGSSDGNPYVYDGCQAPHENCTTCPDTCTSGKPYHCESVGGTSYSSFEPIVAITFISIAVGPLVLLFGCRGLYRFIKRRRKMERRVKFFKMKLKQQLPPHESSVERTKVFTKSELQKATDNFNENRILGQGGQGTVYKGMLIDGTIVAIKKSKLLDESQMEQFINELVILCQINHRNIVKLLGCCLQTEVPLLVYEFVSNGTLAQHIHDPSEDSFISWAMRLKIAADSAGAIAYLHSSSSSPVYHRDIKSLNILLDDKHIAKVSDFGISRTIEIDQTHLTTLVQGTVGYLDPEYFQSNMFTEKSDVYSFGVVLLELLTRKKPIYRAETTEQKFLVTEFLFLVQNSRLSNILDPSITKDATEEQLISFVDLARCCLSSRGELRPTMKEVAMTLELIIKSPDKVFTQDQQVFIDEELHENDMVETSDRNFMSSPLPGAASPTFIDVQPLLPNTK